MNIVLFKASCAKGKKALIMRHIWVLIFERTNLGHVKLLKLHLDIEACIICKMILKLQIVFGLYINP